MYSGDPDWYSPADHPDFVPTPPDAALEFHAELVAYGQKYPAFCRTLPERALRFDTVECLLPGFGIVRYLHMERVALTVFLARQGCDYERVYRYLFLDGECTEEDHAVHQIRTILQRHTRAGRPSGTRIQTRLDRDVLGPDRRDAHAHECRPERHEAQLHPERQRLHLNRQPD